MRSVFPLPKPAVICQQSFLSFKNSDLTSLRTFCCSLVQMQHFSGPHSCFFNLLSNRMSSSWRFWRRNNCAAKWFKNWLFFRDEETEISVIITLKHWKILILYLLSCTNEMLTDLFVTKGQEHIKISTRHSNYEERVKQFTHLRSFQQRILHLNVSLNSFLNSGFV